jgi:flagellar biosynthesis protein FliR
MASFDINKLMTARAVGYPRSQAEKSYFKRKLSTVALLVLTSLDHHLFILKVLFSSFYKTRYLNVEVNCTEPFPSVRVP